MAGRCRCAVLVGAAIDSVTTRQVTRLHFMVAAARRTTLLLSFLLPRPSPREPPALSLERLQPACLFIKDSPSLSFLRANISVSIPYFR
jgi:hypothetical protein